MNGFGSASPPAQIRPQGPRLREPKQMASLCYIYMLHRHNAKADGFPFPLRIISNAEIHPVPNVVLNSSSSALCFACVLARPLAKAGALP